MKYRIELRQGEAIPRGYGLAYKQYHSLTFVCYPIPINIIVRVSREIEYWLMRGCFKSKWEEELRKLTRR